MSVSSKFLGMYFKKEDTFFFVREITERWESQETARCIAITIDTDNNIFSIDNRRTVTVHSGSNFIDKYDFKNAMSKCIEELNKQIL